MALELRVAVAQELIVHVAKEQAVLHHLVDVAQQALCTVSRVEALAVPFCHEVYADEAV